MIFRCSVKVCPIYTSSSQSLLDDLFCVGGTSHTLLRKPVRMQLMRFVDSPEIYSCPNGQKYSQLHGTQVFMASLAFLPTCQPNTFFLFERDSSVSKAKHTPTHFAGGLCNSIILSFSHTLKRKLHLPTGSFKMLPVVNLHLFLSVKVAKSEVMFNFCMGYNPFLMKAHLKS